MSQVYPESDIIVSERVVFDLFLKHWALKGKGGYVFSVFTHAQLASNPLLLMNTLSCIFFCFFSFKKRVSTGGVIFSSFGLNIFNDVV